MKSISSSLLTLLQSEVQTLSIGWLITRRDGEKFGFTNCHKDIEIDGTIFKASLGFNPSNLQADRDFSPNNAELSSVFNVDGITEIDLRTGRYDYAEVKVFLFDYLNPPTALDSEDLLMFPAGILGTVSYSDVTYKAEILSLTELLQGKTGWTTSKECRNVFGDSKCGIDLESLKEEETVSSATKADNFYASKSWEDDYLTGGEIEFLDTPFDGIILTIIKQKGDRIYLASALPSIPEEGISFKVTPNCQKSTSYCKKFDNYSNFNGEPTLPGLDSYASNEDYDN